MDDFWFEELKSFDVGDMKSPSSGLDYFFKEKSNRSVTTADSKVSSKGGNGNRIRISSAQDLEGFERVGDTETLIRMSEQDLWELDQNEDGDYVIERLFDEDGDPLKV